MNKERTPTEYEIGLMRQLRDRLMKSAQSVLEALPDRTDGIDTSGITDAAARMVLEANRLNDRIIDNQPS